MFGHVLKGDQILLWCEGIRPYESGSKSDDEGPAKKETIHFGGKEQRKTLCVLLGVKTQ